MMAMAGPRAPVPRAVLGAIAGAWALALGLSVSGASGALHHHELVEGGPPLWVALGLFAVAWQVHVAAMMLPSSLPLVAMFHQASAAQPSPERARLAFHAGYAAVWTVFGILALAADALVHRTVESWGWLAARPWLVGGSVLLVAGALQFSRLKDACLRECRHPSGFLVRHYRHGPGAAFELGARHGAFCVGCCAGLMVVMVAVGIADIAWMAPFAALMYLEKATAWGHRVVAPVGLSLLALGALVLAHPPWLPDLLGAS